MTDLPVFKRRKPDEPSPPVDPPAPAAGVRVEPTAGPVRTEDYGLGVPPFRPALPPSAPLKESPAMGRAPFPGTPAPAPQAPMPVSPPRPVGGAPGRQPAERRTLVVGRGISVQGVVQDAERLVVEGTVESTMIHDTELVVSQGGVFRGEVEVEDAEVAGTIDGTLTARGNMIVRATGKVLGTARCRRLRTAEPARVGEMPD
jgi:cytoskeletal protein CcmA (bactofilin family)